jgi:hypothetical protein
MSDHRTINKVPAELLIRANSAAAKGPRGFENAMISIIKELSAESSPDNLVAISYRLQALAKLSADGDISGMTMRLHGKQYKLINEAALKAAACCPLALPELMSDIEFDREEFLRLALTFAEADANG